jgi:hypothetical protein
MIANREEVGVILTNYSQLDTLCTGVSLTREVLMGGETEPILANLPAEAMMQSLTERIAAGRPHKKGLPDIHMPLDLLEVAVATFVLINLGIFHPDEFEKQFSKEMLSELKEAMHQSEHTQLPKS